MSDKSLHCPDCDGMETSVPRRTFLKSASVAAVAASSVPVFAHARDTKKKTREPESVVKVLYESLNDDQKKEVCFDWDYKDPKRGLLRRRISNNWMITKPTINGEFYNSDQQAMIREIFEGIIQPDWHGRYYKQLQDDAGGFGRRQSIAIFGKPGDDKFEFVMTGRHMTLRCDGNSTEHMAFGGPIFYGHAAQGFNEKPDHPGNVFWEQALAANDVCKMLDGKQRKQAVITGKMISESEIGFRGKEGEFPGLPVSEMSSDQKAEMERVLAKLVEPYRSTDQQEVKDCLAAQGGLDECSLAFYEQGDIGNDKVYDVWRLEGPSFVWHFRGKPHVHVWVHIADNAKVETNAQG